MSSDYRILCLSHDPAIEIDGTDYHSSRNGHLAAVEAAANPSQHGALRGHAHCDLVVGRYSYPLIEVCCPPDHRTQDLRHHRRHPPEGIWIDVEWLRLLLLAQRHPADSPIGKAAAGAVRANRCWTPERLQRLRHHLIPEGTEHEDITREGGQP